MILKEGEREGQDRKIEKEMILLFKLLIDDYMKLCCLYYFLK